MVVVLHGGPGAPGSAAGLAKALAKDFLVLEPLQRRSGLVPLTVSQHVEDLKAVAPKPAILIGCSWGAMLGLSFAARYPKQVLDLVLVGCGTYDDVSRKLLFQLLRRRQSATDACRVKNLQKRCASEQDPTRRDALLAEIGSALMRAESYDLVDESAENISPDAVGNVETWEDVLRLQHEGIEPNSFSAIKARVLMLHGDVDPHPGVETRDLLRRFIPKLEYIGLERCGHEPWRERYAREPFLDILRKWILRMGNGRPAGALS